MKCCIRSILSKKYNKKVVKKCEKYSINFDDLKKMIEPILKEVVISLGDLKTILNYDSDEYSSKLKKFFLNFLIWYLRKEYMYYLLFEGKMNFKERYIEYKNKYVLNLLVLIRE